MTWTRCKVPHKVRILQTYFDEVWKKGNVEALHTLLAPNARTRGILGGEPFDANELAELVTMTRALIGPVSVAFPIVIEKDDWLSALVEIKSHALHNGDPIHVFNQMLVRFEGERMIEVSSNLDALSLFEQLGLLPENAMVMMLAGTRLS